MGGFAKRCNSELTRVHVEHSDTAVGVATGTEDAVTSVFRLPYFFAILSLLSGCELYRNHLGSELDLYNGLRRENHEVAIIDQGSRCSNCVKRIKRVDQEHPIYIIHDGFPLYRYSGDEPRLIRSRYLNKLKLLPGRYEITIGKPREYSGAPRWSGSVDLEPGHYYHVLTASGCYPNCTFTSGRTKEDRRVWMEDAETGEVLLGNKM